MKAPFPGPAIRYQSARRVAWMSAGMTIFAFALGAWAFHRGRPGTWGIVLGVVYLVCTMIAIRRARKLRDQATPIELYPTTKL